MNYNDNSNRNTRTPNRIHAMRTRSSYGSTNTDIDIDADIHGRSDEFDYNSKHGPIESFNNEYSNNNDNNNNDHNDNDEEYDDIEYDDNEYNDNEYNDDDGDGDDASTSSSGSSIFVKSYDTIKKSNTSGMSIFDFDNDSDNDDNSLNGSLLVSPILADYFPMNIDRVKVRDEDGDGKADRNRNTNTKEHGVRNRNADADKENTKVNKNSNNIMSPDQQEEEEDIMFIGKKSTFMSPTIHQTKNVSKGNLVSASVSATRGTRSSARLRRRREILFSSPKEQQMEHEQNDYQNEMEQAQFENENKSVRNNRSSISSTTTSDDRRQKLSLLRGALDTSFCPSLGLGSSLEDDNSNDNENDNDNDDGSDPTHTIDSHCDGTISRSKRRSSFGLGQTLKEGTNMEIREEVEEEMETEEPHIDNNNTYTANQNQNRLMIEKCESDDDISFDSSSSVSSNDNHTRNNISATSNISIRSNISIKSNSSNGSNISIGYSNSSSSNDNTNLIESLNETLQDLEMNEKKEEKQSTKQQQHVQKEEEHQRQHQEQGGEQYDKEDNNYESSIHFMNHLIGGEENLIQQLTNTSQELLVDFPSMMETKPNTKSTNATSIPQTPPRSSSKKKRKSSLNLTPKLKEAAKQTLTPVLNALRSKLRGDKTIATINATADDSKITDASTTAAATNEESRKADGENNEDGIVKELQSSRDDKVDTTQEDHVIMDEDQKLLKVSFLDQKNKSPPLVQMEVKSLDEGKESESEIEANTSITPVLKTLRSKLYHGINDSKINNAQDTSVINSTMSDIHTVQTPGTEKAAVKDAVEDDKEQNKTPKTPLDVDGADGTELSLTPALRAFRSKLLLGPTSTSKANSSEKFIDSTISPIIGSNESINYALYRGSLYSPPIRESSAIKTPKTATSVKSEFTFTVDGDDSYFAQRKDLSSAKKNLNAQSSALAERLRGAAQKRMANLTNKRDSLAAKENVHFERKESERLSSEKRSIEKEQKRIDPKNKKKSNTPSNQKTQNKEFKARPLPSSVKFGSGPSGIPEVVKKSTTKAISPKLGIRRQKKSKSQESSSKYPSQQSDPFYVPPFKARPVPSFVSKEGNKVNNNLPKTKRRGLTKPISPMLGIKRNIHQKKGVIKEKVHTKTQFKLTQGNRNKSEESPTDPLGLDFLSKTPSVKNHESIPPTQTCNTFHLHSTERAKERAKFNSSFALRDKQREKQKKIDTDLLIKQRLLELEELKKSLR